MKVCATNSQVCAEVFTQSDKTPTDTCESFAWFNIFGFSSSKWRKDWNIDKRKFSIFSCRELDWTCLTTNKTEGTNAKTIWSRHPHPKVVQESFRRGHDEKAELSDMLVHPFMSWFSTIIGILVLQCVISSGNFFKFCTSCIFFPVEKT